MSGISRLTLGGVLDLILTVFSEYSREGPFARRVLACVNGLGKKVAISKPSDCVCLGRAAIDNPGDQFFPFRDPFRGAATRITGYRLSGDWRGVILLNS